MVMADGAAPSDRHFWRSHLASRLTGPTPTLARSPASARPWPSSAERGPGGEPTIFGVAFAVAYKDLGATALPPRWGSNTTTRYSYKLSAWNTTFTWFWQNIKMTPRGLPRLKGRRRAGLAAITTFHDGLRVAKDTSSASFPVSVFSAQEKTDPVIPISGSKKPGSRTELRRRPTRTSVPFLRPPTSPTSSRACAREEDRQELVFEWILDNEPGLWNDPPRVQPTALLTSRRDDRVQHRHRKADPDAIMAPRPPRMVGVLHSEGSRRGMRAKPDPARRTAIMHRVVPAEARRHEKKTGVPHPRCSDDA
jgi:hypothetical protein